MTTSYTRWPHQFPRPLPTFCSLLWSFEQAVAGWARAEPEGGIFQNEGAYTALEIPGSCIHSRLWLKASKTHSDPLDTNLTRSIARLNHPVHNGPQNIVSWRPCAADYHSRRDQKSTQRSSYWLRLDEEDKALTLKRFSSSSQRCWNWLVHKEAVNAKCVSFLPAGSKEFSEVGLTRKSDHHYRRRRFCPEARQFNY